MTSMTQTQGSFTASFIALCFVLSLTAPATAHAADIDYGELTVLRDRCFSHPDERVRVAFAHLVERKHIASSPNDPSWRPHLSREAASRIRKDVAASADPKAIESLKILHSRGLLRPMPVGQGMTAATYVSDRAYFERRVDSRGIRWPDSAPYHYAICTVMLAVCNGLDRNWSWQGFRSDDADAIRTIVAQDDDRTAKTALSFLDHHGLLAAGPSDTPPPSPVVSAGTSGVVVQARALAAQATQLVEEARSRGAALVRSDEYSRRYIGNLIDHALGTVEGLRALTGHGSTPGENEELELLYRPVAASYNALARWWNTFNAP